MRTLTLQRLVAAAHLQQVVLVVSIPTETALVEGTGRSIPRRHPRARSATQGGFVGPPPRCGALMRVETGDYNKTILMRYM